MLTSTALQVTSGEIYCRLSWMNATCPLNCFFRIAGFGLSRSSGVLSRRSLMGTGSSGGRVVLVHELRRQLKAAKQNAEDWCRRCYELNQRLADMQQLVTKLNTDRMLAQRDAETLRDKNRHLLDKVARLEALDETSRRLTHAMELRLPPFAPD